MVYNYIHVTHNLGFNIMKEALRGAACCQMAATIYILAGASNRRVKTTYRCFGPNVNNDNNNNKRNEIRFFFSFTRGSVYRFLWFFYKACLNGMGDGRDSNKGNTSKSDGCACVQYV